MPRHDYVRQKIIVCAEIDGRLLAELPSRSPVSSAAASRVKLLTRVVKLLDDRDYIPFQSDWIGNVKNILCESGFTFVWLQQETVNPKWLKGLLHKRLADINRQKWHNEMNVNSHCESYQMFKDNLRREP